jgi:hypothetical protein
VASLVRRVAATLGGAAVLLGLLTAVAPGAAPLEVDRLGTYAAALLGLVLLVVAVQARRRADVQRATFLEPERRHAFPTPGADLDRIVARGFAGTDVDAVRTREQLRDRLYPIAVNTVMRRENVSRERAEKLLETGEWTDDRLAARYFAGPRVEVAVTERLRRRLRGQSMRAVYARHAVDDLAQEVVE